MEESKESPNPVAPKRLIDVPGLAAIRESEQTRLMLIGVLVGAIGGVVAGGFDWLLVGIGELLLGVTNPEANAPVAWRALLAPAGAGLVAGLVIWLATRKGRPQSIADVMEGVILHEGKVSLREGLPSAAASVLAVGGGMSGGREGPIVQLSSALVSLLARRFKLPPQTARVLVAGGAAAGIAASFNTPLGGAFFALEVLLGNFALVSFAPVVAATVTGTVVGQFLLGHDRIALVLPPFELGSVGSLLIYPLLGVFSGVIAVSFKRLFGRFDELWPRLRVPRPLRAGLAGLLVGVLAALGANEIMGNGYVFMERIISGEAPGVAVLLAITAAKIVASAASSTSGSGVGVFSASLFVGAVAGTLFGNVAYFLFPGIAGPPGMYGMVGMGAVAAAVSHAPITMMLMLFEMTHNYEVVLPLLLTIAVALVFSNLVEKRSIYVLSLEGRGVRVDRGREELVMYDLRVDDVMREDLQATIAPEAPFRELAKAFFARRADEIYAVDAEGRYLGFIDIQDIKELLSDPHRDDITVADLARTDAPTLHPTAPLAETMPLFFRSGLEALPVLDDAHKLVGVLNERDVVGAYNREVLRHDALLARVESGPAHARQTDFFVLPDGHVMERVNVTERLAGHSLRDLRLPGRFGVTVLAVDVLDDKGGFDRRPTEADLVLKVGDGLIVVGTEDNVQGLKLAQLGAPTAAPPPDRGL